jgi:glycosyltransferase involved in cell wall biosynthesis
MAPQNIVIKGAVGNVDGFATASSDKVYSEGQAKHLVYVGRLAPEKNVDKLLEAFSAAVKSHKNASLRLSIVGTGPLEQELRQRCSELGIQELVEFKGYCPQRELPKLLRTADFFVLPSLREPWGLVALEAMLCRVPVLISTQCGCAADLVTRETGWTFSPWSKTELTDLLQTLPRVPAERVARMGSAAQELASRYSAAECARRVFHSIQQLAGAESPNSERAFQHV